MNTAIETGISHLSFSAVRDYLADRRNFRKRWIDHDWSRKPELALVEGSTFHAGLEIYWGMICAGLMEDTSTVKRGIVIDPNEIKHAMTMVATKEYPPSAGAITKRIAKADIPEYEALGCTIEETEHVSTKGRKSTTYKAVMTPEAIVEIVLKSIDAYMGERNETVYTPLAIEQAHVGETFDFETKEAHPFPLKARIDLIARHEGELVVVDHKYMGDDPEEDEDGNLVATPAMQLQAAAYESLAPSLLKELGIEGTIETVIFDIFNKKTGRLTQLRLKVTDAHRAAWSRLYSTVQEEIMIAYNGRDFDRAFPPNPDALFNSDGWTEFMRDIEISLAGQVCEVKPTEDYEAYEL